MNTRRTSEDYIVHGNYRHNAHAYVARVRWEGWRRTYWKDFGIEIEHSRVPSFVSSFMVPGDMIRLIRIGQQRRVPNAIMNYLYNQIPEPARHKFKVRKYVKNLLENHNGRIEGIHFPVIPEITINSITQ